MSGTDIYMSKKVNVNVTRDKMRVTNVTSVTLQQRNLGRIMKSWKGEIPPEGEIPIKDYYLP